MKITNRSEKDESKKEFLENVLKELPKVTIDQYEGGDKLLRIMWYLGKYLTNAQIDWVIREFEDILRETHIDSYFRAIAINKQKWETAQKLSEDSLFRELQDLLNKYKR